MIKKYLGFLLSMILAVSILSGCTQSIEPQKVKEEAVVVEDKQEATILEKIDLGVLSPVFLNAREAAIALSQEDDYIKVLSPYDYASKYKSENPLTQEERLTFFQSKTLEFSDTEMKKLNDSMAVIYEKIGSSDIALPDKVGFIKTDGTEEGGAAYTRAENIIIPERYFGMSKMNFDALIAHEYFHVYSRYFTEYRPELYELIGFKTAKEVNLPESIKSLTIANPDAPDTIYYFTDLYEGQEMHFLPIIYSSEAYDIDRKVSFFETMIIEVIAVTDDNGILNPVLKNGKAIFTDFETLPKFVEATGGNTDYIIHPEEILADNFSIYIMDLEVNEQWVIDALLKKMSEF